MRKLLLISLAALGMLLAAPTAAPATPATSSGLIVMTFDNFGFSDPSPSCPEGLITFDIASLGGTPLGTGSSCMQSFEGCEPFVVGCHQLIRTLLTFHLTGRDPIRVRATLHEVVLDDDPFTVAQVAHGTVVDGRGQLWGAGTVTFTATGVESTLVYVLRVAGTR